MVTRLTFTNVNSLALDEFKIKGFLEENSIKHGGIITDFSFQTQSLMEILVLDGEDNIATTVKHSGQHSYYDI